MSKRFKSQDYFRYKKLGKRWRRPVGLQSKLRLGKGGSGMKPAIGYGTHAKQQPVLVKNIRDFEKDCTAGVIISSGVGSRKTAILAAKAKELGLTIANMKKVKRATRLEKALKEKKTKKKKEVKEEKKESKGEKSKGETKSEVKAEVKTEKSKDKATGKKSEKVIGFDEDVIPQLKAGKKKTYRIRDHNLKVGDNVVFKNTQSGETLGHAKITRVEKTTVERFNLKDPDHYVVYNSTEELIAALKKRNPDKQITEKTEMFAYTYDFTPLEKTKEHKHTA